jgi:hypothetical protein
MRLMTAAAMTALMILPAAAQEPMRMSHPGERNGPERHCVVDGDTIWFGERLPSLAIGLKPTGAASDVEADLCNRA